MPKIAALAALAAVVAAAFGLGRGEGPRLAFADRTPPTGTSAPSTPQARVLSDRDPFSPPSALRTPNSSPAPPADGGAPDAISSEPTVIGSPPSPPASTVLPPPPPDCGDALPSECRRVGSHVIELLRVMGRHRRPSVDLEVDGDPETDVRQGDRFAGGFKLVGFNDALCPHFVFGEEGLTLCERDRRS